ncbi:MAG: hypothetical protein KDD65_08815 [Bacteroidetes bacterium]|nr:hypothetical protein [Bacteroidota bacterium]
MCTTLAGEAMPVAREHLQVSADEHPGHETAQIALAQQIVLSERLTRDHRIRAPALVLNRPHERMLPREGTHRPETM